LDRPELQWYQQADARFDPNVDHLARVGRQVQREDEVAVAVGLAALRPVRPGEPGVMTTLPVRHEGIDKGDARVVHHQQTAHWLLAGVADIQTKPVGRAGKTQGEGGTVGSLEVKSPGEP